jgi:hypothetical protein
MSPLDKHIFPGNLGSFALGKLQVYFSLMFLENLVKSLSPQGSSQRITFCSFNHERKKKLNKTIGPQTFELKQQF